MQYIRVPFNHNSFKAFGFATNNAKIVATNNVCVSLFFKWKGDFSCHGDNTTLLDAYSSIPRWNCKNLQSPCQLFRRLVQMYPQPWVHTSSESIQYEGIFRVERLVVVVVVVTPPPHLVWSSVCMHLKMHLLQKNAFFFCREFWISTLCLYNPLAAYLMLLHWSSGPTTFGSCVSSHSHFSVPVLYTRVHWLPIVHPSIMYSARQNNVVRRQPKFAKKQC